MIRKIIKFMTIFCLFAKFYWIDFLLQITILQKLFMDYRSTYFIVMIILSLMFIILNKSNLDVYASTVIAIQKVITIFFKSYLLSITTSIIIIFNIACNMFLFAIFTTFYNKTEVYKMLRIFIKLLPWWKAVLFGLTFISFFLPNRFLVLELSRTYRFILVLMFFFLSLFFWELVPLFWFYFELIGSWSAIL